MFRKSSSRSQRSKGNIKHILQICMLLGVCLWLIYQVKHSYDKRKEFDEKDAKSSSKARNDDVILKFGRQNLPYVQEVSKNYKHEEEEEENGVAEENKLDEEQEEKAKRLEEEEHEETSKHEEEAEEREELQENEDSKRHDEEQEAEIKDEEAEDEGRGDGDDEVDENEQERADGEADHEKGFID